MNTTTKITRDDVLGAECRFAVYCPPPPGSNDDVHYIKEIVHTKDGRRIPRIVPRVNYKYDIYITRPGFRNHKDKKEHEDLDKVAKFTTTQSKLIGTICNALNMPYPKRDDYRVVARSPYLYGSDILSTARIKQEYIDRWPNLASEYTVASFDVETNVHSVKNEIIMASLTMKERVVTVIDKNFFKGHIDVENQLRQKLVHYLGPYVEKRKIQWEIVMVDNEAEIVVECFRRAHAWKPDFVEIWNIDYDIQKVLTALSRHGIDPKDVFSDPAVDPKYRHFFYKQGPKKKKKANGDVTPIKPADQWHTVYCPASFYFIDGMCVYRKIRMAKGEEQSYSLDFILDKVLGIRKLNFKEAEGLVKLKWHQFMQKNYPFEYTIYNVFDCVSMEELDEKTLDLRLAIGQFCGSSDFETFKSQPRRTADKLHFNALKHGRVFGSTSDQMTEEFDKLTLGLDDWITTLPAHLVVHNGLRVVEEDPNMVTNIRAHVGDLDVAASYPNGECVFNVSKETTFRELCRVENVPESVQRAQGINLSGGATNAVEIATEFFGLPSLEQLLQAYRNQNSMQTQLLPPAQ